MKKIYLTLGLTSLLFTSQAQNGQIPNGGFENWSTVTLYDYLTQWVNGNTQDYRGVATLLKSTDAFHGSYSAEILAAQLPNSTDISWGFVAQGQFGNDGPEGGFPYTHEFDQVRVHYKCNLPNAEDNIHIVMIRFVGGAPIDFTVEPIINGTQNTWTEAIIDVTQLAQEELFIGFVIGNPFEEDVEPTPGAWARLDRVSIYNNGSQIADIPDFSFEAWDEMETELPDNWYTTNEWFAGIGMETVKKTTDASNGSYAIEISTLQFPWTDGDTLRGFVSLGAIDLNNWMNPFSGIPYNASPSIVSGSYKYEAVNNDAAAIVFTWYNSGTDIYSYSVLSPGTTGYENFSENMLPFPMTPDELRIVMFSGNNPGSVLKVDNLSLTGGNVGLDEFSKMNVTLYPNPAKDQLFINADQQHSYSIMDVAGNLVQSGKNAAGVYVLNIDDLSSGMYIFHLNTDHKSESIRFVKE